MDGCLNHDLMKRCLSQIIIADGTEKRSFMSQDKKLCSRFVLGRFQVTVKTEAV